MLFFIVDPTITAPIFHLTKRLVLDINDWQSLTHPPRGINRCAIKIASLLFSMVRSIISGKRKRFLKRKGTLFNLTPTLRFFLRSMTNMAWSASNICEGCFLLQFMMRKNKHSFARGTVLERNRSNIILMEM